MKNTTRVPIFMHEPFGLTYLTTKKHLSNSNTQTFSFVSLSVLARRCRFIQLLGFIDRQKSNRNRSRKGGKRRRPHHTTKDHHGDRGQTHRESLAGHYEVGRQIRFQVFGSRCPFNGWGDARQARRLPRCLFRRSQSYNDGAVFCFRRCRRRPKRRSSLHVAAYESG